MATYKLIPSSLTGRNPITDASNAYTDTDSETYARVDSGGYYYLGGFDFSVIPVDWEDQFAKVLFQIKVKAMHRSFSGTTEAVLVSNKTGGIELSDKVTFPHGTPRSGFIEYLATFVTHCTFSEIMQYAETLCIKFDTNSGFYVYGAEVIIDTIPFQKNKIIYGNETLIDLTGDTATASDVAVGKTFHLASGVQATGTLVASPSSVTIDTTKSPTTLRELTCIGLTKEPSWFVLIFYASNGGNTGQTKRIMHALYDGTTLATWNVDSTEGAINKYTNRCSFSYSSGTLTLTIPSSINYPYFGQGTWKLYYM